MRISTELHPHYPYDWLNKSQAEEFLAENGLTRRVTVAFCRRNQLEVSSTGHVRSASLQNYIWREKDDQGELGQELEREWSAHYNADIASGLRR